MSGQHSFYIPFANQVYILFPLKNISFVSRNLIGFLAKRNQSYCFKINRLNVFCKNGVFEFCFEKFAKHLSRSFFLIKGCNFINPFVPSAPFLYPLKSSENLMVF